MTNYILIDAWNVCFKIPKIASLIPDHLETARERFNSLIRLYFSTRKVTFKIVYDGQPDIFTDNFKQNQSVSFSRNPEKADDLIISYIQKQKNRRGITVITSDRQLSLRARDLGAKVLSSELFIQKIQRKDNKKANNSEKQNPSIGQEEIDYWLKKFSDDDQE